jgi:hypothetical protein
VKVGDEGPGDAQVPPREQLSLPLHS